MYQRCFISKNANIGLGFKCGAGTIVDNATIGENVTIGRFSIIESDVVIGNNCIIMDYVKLMPGTRIGNNCKLDDYVNTSGYCEIGNNVRIKRCSMIGQATRIEDDVWIGSHITTTRIKYPRAMNEETEQEEWVIIKHGSIIGSAATLLAGVTIGENAVVGAGSVVSKDCDPYGIYIGCPAKLMRSRKR